jgi:hypothetical protein
MKYEVIRVRPEECTRIWKSVKPILAPAIERSNGRWTADYVLASLVTGEMRLVVTCDKDGFVGAGIVQEILYPERKSLSIFFLGGNNFADWFLLYFDNLKQLAKELQCDFLECNGRVGFEKIFKANGVKKTAHFYEIGLE